MQGAVIAEFLRFSGLYGGELLGKIGEAFALIRRYVFRLLGAGYQVFCPGARSGNTA